MRVAYHPGLTARSLRRQRVRIEVATDDRLALLAAGPTTCADPLAVELAHCRRGAIREHPRHSVVRRDPRSIGPFAERCDDELADDRRFVSVARARTPGPLS